MNLVIVESPAKAKTINKYLGKDFKVLASYGHVRDLVPKEGAVDPSDDFRMKYQVIDRNDRHVQAISKALKGAESPSTSPLTRTVRVKPSPGIFTNCSRAAAN